MPRLPDFTALGAPVQPVASEAIPHYSADGFFDTSENGLQKIGKAITDFAAGEKKSADKLQAAQADAQFQSDWLSTISDLQHNPDYNSVPGLYQQRTKQALDNAAANISDPDQRELFIAKHADNVARGAYKLNQYVWQQRTDATIADTQTKLEDIRSKALLAADPQVRTQLITTGRNLITGLSDAGYVDRVTAQKLQKDWTNKYATDALNAMAPDDVMGIVTKALGQKPTEQQLSTQGPQSSAAPSLDAARAAIQKIESGGNYAIVSRPSPNGDRAYGAYQVMGANVGPWTEQYYGQRLTPEQFLQNKDAQDAVFDGQFGAYLQKYGPQGAARAWFAGEKGMDNSQASDVNGTTVADYEKQFSSLYGAGTDLSAESRQKTGTVADFLTVDQLQAAYKNAERRKQANILDQERAVRFQDMQQKHISEQEVGNLLPRIYGNDTALTAQEVLADPKLTVQDKEHVIRLMHTGGDSSDVKSFGPGFYDLFSRIHAPDDDPNKITDPSQLYSHVGPNGDLTVRGLDKLRGELQSKRTPEGEAEAAMKKQFLDNAKRQISGTDPILHIRDPKGDELYLKFLAQFYKAYDAGKQGGKSASQLLNPDSPDYLGKGISDFRRTPDQMFKDMMSGPDALGGTPADTSGGTSAPLDVNSIKTVQQAVDAYRSGKITKAQADQLAISRGWGYRPAPTPTIPLSR